MNSSNPKSMDTTKTVEEAVEMPQFIPYYSKIENERREDSIHYGLFDWRDEEMQLSHGKAAWDKVGWSRDGWVI